jgi:hypothetical protein
MAPTVKLWRRAVDQRITNPLVVALGMIVRDELTNRATQVPFPQRQDPIQAFLFD